MHKVFTYGLTGLLGNGTTQCVDDETLVLSVSEILLNPDIFFVEYLIWICFS
jgi:hypothetical protein